MDWANPTVCHHFFLGEGIVNSFEIQNMQGLMRSTECIPIARMRSNKRNQQETKHILGNQVRLVGGPMLGSHESSKSNSELS